jgi:hypothetical protein
MVETGAIYEKQGWRFSTKIIAYDITVSLIRILLINRRQTESCLENNPKCLILLGLRHKTTRNP